MRKHIASVLLVCLLGLSLHETNAQENGFRIDAGLNRATVAGEPVAFTVEATGGALAACTWTIAVPVPRLKAEDEGRILGEACALTLPGEFTERRVGLWTVEIVAESEDGEIASDHVTIRVAPNTAGSLVLGYGVIFGIIALYIGWMSWRMRTLRRQAARLDTTTDDAL